MKQLIFIIALGTMISIPFIGMTDTDSNTGNETLTTECSNNDGVCTGIVFHSDDGSAGSVSCDCDSTVDGESSGIEADLESPPGTFMTQSDLDEACESFLEQCPASDSDGGCSVSNISIPKNTSILSLLFF